MMQCEIARPLSPSVTDELDKTVELYRKLRIAYVVDAGQDSILPASNQWRRSRLREVRHAERLCEHLLHDPPMNVREAEVSSLKLERETRVIDAQAVRIVPQMSRRCESWI